MPVLKKGFFYIMKQDAVNDRIVKGLGGPIGFADAERAKTYSDALRASLKDAIYTVRPALNSRALGPQVYKSA
jgi:hypothetical protein